MSKESKAGLLERGAEFYKRFNYFLGAVAVAGYFVLPAPWKELSLAFGVLQFVEGTIVGDHLGNKSKTPKLKT